MLNDNEKTEVEGRSYLNPQIALDETTSFIDNLRASQAQQNQGIATDTRMLGTDVPSVQGGLTSGDSYFTSRYAVPQTNAAVANLRAAAQAQALNEVLATEQAIWKNRYQQAYRDYQTRMNNKTNATQNPENPYGDDPDEDPVYKAEGETLTAEENTLVLPQAGTTDTGAVSAINAISGVTGQGQIPTDSSEAGILVDKNGNRTAIKVYRGKGIEVAGGASYNKSGAKKFLSDWVKSGGQVLNFTGGGNYGTNMIYWDLQ